jgi:hypothetical protein
MSENFGEIDFPNIDFPVNMLVDYIRVYQHPDRINVGCDPEGFPTNNYISRFADAYTNPNLTVCHSYFFRTPGCSHSCVFPGRPGSMTIIKQNPRIG